MAVLKKPVHELAELLAERQGGALEFVARSGDPDHHRAERCPLCGGGPVILYHDTDAAECAQCSETRVDVFLCELKRGNDRPTLADLGIGSPGNGRHHAPMGDVMTTTTIEKLGKAMVSFGDLKEEAPDTPWLWHGYLAPKVVTILSAKPKAGKSTLEFDLFRCLADGAPCCGRETRPARVLYVSEESASPLLEKVNKLGLGSGSHVKVIVHRRLDARVTWAQLVDGIAEGFAEQFDLVVFDTYNALAGFRGDQENGSGDQLERMAPIKRLAEKGPGVLLVCHERKSEGSSRVDQIRGGNALAGEADVILSLDKVAGDEAARVLHGIGRFDATPAAWTIRLEEDRFVAVGNLAAAAEQERHRDIAQLVAEYGSPVTADEFAGIIRRSPATAARKLKAAEAAGSLGKTGSGSKVDPYRYATPGMVVITSTGPMGDGDEHAGERGPDGGALTAEAAA